MGRTPLFHLLQRAARIARAAAHDPAPLDEFYEQWSRTPRRSFAPALAAGRGRGPVAGRLQHAAETPASSVFDRLRMIGSRHRRRRHRRAHRGVALAPAGRAGARVRGADRIGGRMFSLRNHFPDGQVIELGGELIDSDHVRLRALAAELGLVLDDLLEGDTDHDTWFFDGRALSEREIVAAFVPVAAAIERDLATLGDGDILHDAHQNADALDALSIAQWLDRNGVSGWLRKLIDVAYTTEMGLEIDQQSALNLLTFIGTDDKDRFAVFGVSDERSHVRGGNDLIVHGLGAKLSRCGRDRQRAGSRARRCVGIHADVPPRWRDARRGRATGDPRHAVHAAAQGAHRRGLAGREAPRDRHARLRHQRQADDRLRPPRLARARRQRRVLQRPAVPDHLGNHAQAAGQRRRADQFHRRPPWRRTRAGHAEAAGRRMRPPPSNAMFPGAVAARAGAREVRMHWPTHPWTLGSYACFRPGDWTGLRGAMGESVGGLHFAGEHCALDTQGFMEGGCESGETAAAAVLQAMGRGATAAHRAAHEPRFLNPSVFFCTAACIRANDSFTIGLHPTWGREQKPEAVRRSGLFLWPMPQSRRERSRHRGLSGLPGPRHRRACSRGFAPEVLADARLHDKLRRGRARQRFRHRHAGATAASCSRGCAADDGAHRCRRRCSMPTTAPNGRRLLRRYRAAESTRLVWRDVLGLDDVEPRSPAARDWPKPACSWRWRRWKPSSRERHGVVRDGGRTTSQRLVVFGLGKLGGGELNFSSDIDLVYAYAERRRQRWRAPARRRGVLRAPRAATGEAARRGHRGRLQPSRRPAPAAVRQRRPHRAVVRGDGAVLPARGPRLGTLRLAEGAAGRRRHRRRRSVPRHAAAVRLSPLPRFRRARRPARDEGGDRRRSRAQGTRRRHQARPRRHPRDRIPRAGAAADPRRPRAGAARTPPAAGAAGACREAHHVATDTRDALARRTASCAGSRTACRCCATRRRMPCRTMRTIARASPPAWAIADWAALRAALDARRARVADEFDALLAPRRRKPDAGATRRRTGARCPMAATRQALADAGFADAAAPMPRCATSCARPACATCPTARARAWTAWCRRCCRPRGAATTGRRAAAPAGAAAEHPAPRQLSRPARRAAGGAGAAGRCGRAQRLPRRAPGRASVAARRTARRARRRPAARARRVRAGVRAGAAADDDTEAALMALNEARQALGFRIALATLDGRQHAQDSARQLAWLADAVLDVRAGAGAARNARARMARSPDARFAVLGYGSLGGEELGFGSDLDLVFLYDAAARRAVRRRARARRAALVRAPGAEDRRPARHRHRRRAPVRRRRAPASRRRQGPAGVEPGELRRIPARARLDLGTPGAGARALRRRRCERWRAAFARDRATKRWRVRAMPTRCATKSCRCAGACAPNSIAAMPRASTSSRARAAWSTSNSCCSTSCCAMPRGIPRCCVPRDTPGLIDARAARRARSTPPTAQALREAHGVLLAAGLRVHARPSPALGGGERDRRGCTRLGTRRRAGLRAGFRGEAGVAARRGNRNHGPGRSSAGASDVIAAGQRSGGLRFDGSNAMPIPARR